MTKFNPIDKGNFQLNHQVKTRFNHLSNKSFCLKLIFNFALFKYERNNFVVIFNRKLSLQMIVFYLIINHIN